MTLTVVFFNAYGGTWAYAQGKRIDYAAGVLFALTGVPGALLGTEIVKEIPRGQFDVLFAALLIGLGVYLVIRPMRGGFSADGRTSTITWDTADGNRRLLVGAIASAYLGLMSSLLGIGGGILHVPLLIRVLGFNPHTATATSHFVLAIVTFTGALKHLLQGDLDGVLAPTTYLALGVMMGAPLGAAVSYWLRGPLLVRLLALALMGVGARLLWHWFG
jgi:uncharacterized membrane protein YfcA